MLTYETVKLISEFDGWECPNLHQHKFVESKISYTTVDKWDGGHIKGNYKDKVLNEDEQNQLEELLRQNPKSEIYEVVSNFIQWVLRNLPYEGVDFKDHLIMYMEYEYYYLGRKESSYVRGNLPTIFKDNDWFGNSVSRVSFWDRHYRKEYFEKTLPHYVETLRELIQTPPHYVHLKEVV